ncbi:MAG: hypothetical protein K0R61_4734 [Microvirga sp.]|nr:hypothetical protein [Microvirga sp.]
MTPTIGRGMSARNTECQRCLRFALPICLSFFPAATCRCVYRNSCGDVSAHEQRDRRQSLRDSGRPGGIRVGLSPATPARALPAQDPGGARRKDHRGFPKCVAGARNHSSADVLHTAVRRALRIPPAVIAPDLVRVERRGALLGTCEAGPRKAWMRRGAIPDQRSRSPRYATTWRFIPRELTPATSVTSGSKHRKAIFTAAGSPVMCAARSRAGPAPPGGNGLPRMADNTSCCDAG